jgi:hypothetical protein
MAEEACSKRAMTNEGRTKREWIGRMKGGSQEAQVGFDGLAAIRPGNNELGGAGWPRRVLATMGAWSWRGREGLRVGRGGEVVVVVVVVVVAGGSWSRRTICTHSNSTQAVAASQTGSSRRNRHASRQHSVHGGRQRRAKLDNQPKSLSAACFAIRQAWAPISKETSAETTFLAWSAASYIHGR